MRTTTGSGSLEGGLKALAEPTRFLILAMLSKYGKLNVGQIVSALGVNQAGVSQHLRVLRFQGIVEVERTGQWAFYKLVPERIEYILGCLGDLANGRFTIPGELEHKMEAALEQELLINV